MLPDHTLEMGVDSERHAEGSVCSCYFHGHRKIGLPRRTDPDIIRD